MAGLIGLRTLTASLIVAVTLTVLAALAVAAHPRAGAANSSTSPCPNPAIAVAQGGCLIDRWPAIPNEYSKAVANAAFKHDYKTIWGYLDPSYKKVVAETRWELCQKRNPVAPPGVTIRSVKVADSRPVPITLPLLGHLAVRTITLQILFARAGSGQQIALEYAYWIKSYQGKWVAVWLPDVYTKYKAGRCDPAGPTRGLY